MYIIKYMYIDLVLYMYIIIYIDLVLYMYIDSCRVAKVTVHVA